MSKVWQEDCSTHSHRCDLFPSSLSLSLSKSTLPDAYLFTPTQIGTSLGLAISSVVLDRTIARKSRELGLPLPTTDGSVPISKPALLAGYRAVQWLNFAFVMVGLVLAVLFLRQIGIIARRTPKAMVGAGAAEEQSAPKERDISTLPSEQGSDTKSEEKSGDYEGSVPTGVVPLDSTTSTVIDHDERIDGKER